MMQKICFWFVQRCEIREIISGDTYVHLPTAPSLVQLLACHHVDSKHNVKTHEPIYKKCKMRTKLSSAKRHEGRNPLYKETVIPVRRRRPKASDRQNIFREAVFRLDDICQMVVCFRYMVNQTSYIACYFDAAHKAMMPTPTLPKPCLK